jgi:NitT/TauT family transport system ATP-binding protein
MSIQLQVSNVCKTFGHGPQAKLVLDQVSFDLQGGQFLALVGSSGSGKSTVMRLIAGLDRPSSGTITLDGQAVRGPGFDRGMVFQKYSLYPWLTAAQNVAFGMELQQRSRQDIRERTAYFLEVVGLADAARLLPRELSGGMQQRIAIARALAAEPKVLLLDEPFGALDIQIRESMQEFLHGLWRQTGLTALLITHDLEEALLLAGQVHIMAPSPGRIERSVTVELDRRDMAQLRLSPSFLELRENLAQSLRSLEPAGRR